jgi:CDP-ribitol ribitolphosphotransferase
MGNIMKKLIQKYIIIIWNIIFHLVPIKKNQVLFFSSHGNILNGNLEYMSNIVPGKEYHKKVILFNSSVEKRTISQMIKTVYHLSVSKYIFLDDASRYISLLFPRKEQEIIQLWHGPGAFKKIGYSRADKNKNDFSNHRNYTKAITTSEPLRGFIAEGFGMDIKNVYATGYPRTDMFFDDHLISQIREKLFKQYPALQNKKVILFAPTFRGITRGIAHFDNYFLDLETLYNELKDDYIFVFKWHPSVFSQNITKEDSALEYSKYTNFYYDLSDYRDINDLLLITDVLVTDYSSVIFEYSLLNKPIVYFVPDLDEYIDSRGLYFPFEDYLYGEIAKTSKELAEAITKENIMQDKREKFAEKFMNACDGSSSQRLYDVIFKNKV